MSRRTAASGPRTAAAGGPRIMVVLAGVAFGCSAPTPLPSAPAAASATVPAPVPQPTTPPPTAPTSASPRHPWWAHKSAGVYRRNGRPVVLGVGRSSAHHHPAEGFLKAKVQARLSVRRAAGAVAFRGTMPEPILHDMFIDASGTFWALYRLDISDDAEPPLELRPWTIPPWLTVAAGRRRIERHVFEGPRHLYLECDIEGPIANPDWGQTRASAWYTRPVRKDP